MKIRITKVPRQPNMEAYGGNLFGQTNLFDDGGEMPNYEALAEQERARQRNIAKTYFSEAPTLSNLFNGADAFIKSLPFIGITATDVDPHVLTGVAPTPTLPGGYAGNMMRVGLKAANKNGLEVIKAANGKQYVKLPSGGIKSLQSYGEEAYDALYSSPKAKAVRASIENNAIKDVEKRFGSTRNAWNREAPLWDPAVNLKATSGSINRVNGKVSNRGAITANDMFALGGDLQTHGADWSNGSTHVDEGETHEQNPYGGVQVGVDSQGTPNLVEEGEVIWNDYVYSNRIPIDEATKAKFHIGKKKEITYADLAKKLEKEIAERPNDPVSRAGFQSQMLTLQEQQERQKQEMEAERARAAFESLSPEEQVAMMQQAAQQEQVAQEQAMQEQAMTEQAQMEQAEAQQPIEEGMYAPEEMGYMSEEVPTEEMPEEGYAEGGNLYPDGGALDKEKYQDYVGKQPQAILRILQEKYLEEPDDVLNRKANELYKQTLKAAKIGRARKWLDSNTTYSNSVKDSLSKMMADQVKTDTYGKYDYNNAFEALIPTHNFGRDNVDKYFKALIENGIDFDTAFDIVNARRGGDRTSLGVRRELAQLKKLLGLKYNTSNNTSSSSVAVPSRTTSASSAAQSNTSNSRGFLSAQRANLKEGREALVARAQQVNNNTVIPEEAAASVSASGASKGRATYGTTASPMMYSGTGYGAPATRPATRRGSSTNRATSTSINSSSSAGSVVSNPTPAQQEPATVAPIPVVTNDGIVINPLTGEPDFIPTEGLVQNNAVYTNNDFAADKAAGYPTADPSSYNSEYSSTKSETATGKEEEKKNEKVPFVTSKESRLRYIPAIGGAIGLAYDLFSKPDYSRADAVINASRNMTPRMIQPTYLGDYLTYRPMDIWAEQNRMNANARATDRAIRNSNSPSRMAGLLASGYNSQIASGELYRKALEYNNALRERTAAFNRGTNQFNAQMNTNTQRANQSAALSGQHYGLQGLITGNQMKDAIDARRGASISANLGNVLQSLGNIGEEAFDMDRLRWLEATDVLRSKTLNQNKYGGMLTKKNKKGGKC